MEICLGTYLNQVSSKGEYAIAEPIDVDIFLGIDPKLSTQIAVDSFFKNKILDEEEFEEEDEQDYDDIDNYDYNDNEQYMTGDPRYDRNENPWIDVFGEGDEAETAYWNTD